MDLPITMVSLHFFMEQTVTSNNYPDGLQHFVLHQNEETMQSFNKMAYHPTTQPLSVNAKVD
jgi:hypothetical protein